MSQISNALNIDQQGIQYFDGNGIFSGITSTAGLVMTSNGPSSPPTYQDAYPIAAVSYFSNANGDTYLSSQWLKCNGSIYSQATYTTLFSRLGLLNPGGTNWTSRTPNTSSVLYGITYGSVYVYGGTAGVLATSTDAITWTVGTSGTASVIFCLTYGTVYVYGGVNGVLATSTDAITWTARTSGSVSGSITNLIYGNGTYIYTGNAVPFQFASSPDAITWTKIYAVGLAGSFFNAAYGNGIFVIGNNTSTDAITWKTSYINPLSYNQLLFSNSQFVIPGNFSVGTSTDGNLFTAQNTGTSSSILALTYGTVYVYGGVGGVLATSTDAITWTARTSGTTSSILALTYGTVYVYGGNGGVLASSTDAITWTARTSGTTSSILSLTYGTVYVYGGNGGVLASSTDAITWTARTSGTTSSIFCLTYGTVYVHGGAGGAIASSTDAITWTARTSGTTSSIFALIYAGGQYVYGGSSGAIGTSTDGTTWVPQTGIGSAAALSLAYNGSYYLLCANLGTFTSTDAVTWTALNSPKFVQYLAYNSNLSTFVIYSGGTTSTLYTSTDIVSFTPIHLPASVTINVMACENDTTVVMAGTTIYTSTDLNTWRTQTGPLTSPFAMVGSPSLFVAVGNNSGIAGIETSPSTYTYNPATQFQVPTDAQAAITVETTQNFERSLYIKAL